MSYKIAFAAILLIAFSGCKLQKEKEKTQTPSVEGYRVGDAIRAERFLNAAEKVIGTRVCRDLRAKRNSWEVSRDGISLGLDIRANSCSSRALSTYALQVGVELSGGDLVFETPSSARHIVEVLTDEHQAIANICDELIAGEADVENTVEMGGARFQTTFYEVGSRHFVLISRFKLEGGTWRATLVDESAVIVQERTSSASAVGLVQSRIQEAQCSGGGASYIEQKLR